MFYIQLTSRFSGHSKPVTAVKFVNKFVLTGSSDHATKVWSADGHEVASATHSSSILSLSVHPTSEYYAALCADSWSIHDVATCSTKLTVTGDNFSCASFHPDGLLFGAGTSKGVVKLWEVLQSKEVASFSHEGAAITSLAFSENGYYFATGDDKNTVKVWDLRKLKELKSFGEGETGSSGKSSIMSLEFDYTGQYLAVGGSTGGLGIIYTKDWSLVNTLDGNAAITGIKFGRNAHFVTATNGSGKSLLFFGHESAASPVLTATQMNADLK